MAVTKRMWGDKHGGNIRVFKAKRGSWGGISSVKLDVWLIQCEVAPNQDPEWL